MRTDATEHGHWLRNSFRKRYFPASTIPFLLALPVLGYMLLGGVPEVVLVLMLALLFNCLFLTMMEFTVLLLACNLLYALFFREHGAYDGSELLTGMLLFSTLLLYARYTIFHKLMILSESNHYLTEKAMVDALTGIYNRHYLYESGRRVFHGFVRGGLPFSVVMLDIDEFKRINDTHGHDGGDTALLWFSGLLNRVMRLQDVAGRFGGDEFLVIMPGTEKEQALRAVRRLQKELARDKDAPEFCRGMRVSMGLAQVRVLDSDFNDVVRRADEDLYEAKRKGRQMHA
ncbi:MAG: GGDEF domain-containing protein [Gammaproteobacteria bacterium]